MPELLFDLSSRDLTRDVVPLSEIRASVPHRHEFALLDGVLAYQPDPVEAVGYHDARPDAFWVRGHIPGSPLFPGCLMVEAAAQLSSFCYRKRFGVDENRFFGFGGIDKVKFRSMVVPGKRLLLLCREIKLDRRYSRFAVQGVCEGTITFDGEIIGVIMPVTNAGGPAAG
ncbi:MAG TPA: 3-hydroxyacyl-ACP dehydratase FabZ family protein [Planctomycetota bacterium]|nr:3-hydroxyacyl-ACP dehydratase FabZ family protein [Planctomycetota bacterium]